MTPMATQLPLNWTEYTPVAMMAQDLFPLRVNAKAPCSARVAHSGCYGPMASSGRWL